MDWTLVAWVGGYLVAAVVTARRWLVVTYREQHSLGSEDYALAAGLGVVWPIVAAGLLLYALLTPGVVHRDRRAAAARKAAEAACLAAAEVEDSTVRQARDVHGMQVERCACGGVRLDGYGPWIERNTRSR